MGWAETRKNARRVVHSTFALPAVYTAPDGTQTPCSARKHNVARVFGDLDRENYAQRIEDVNTIIFDKIEVEPVRKGTVTFPDSGETYTIVNLLPDTTDDFRRVEVTLA